MEKRVYCDSRFDCKINELNNEGSAIKNYILNKDVFLRASIAQSWRNHQRVKDIFDKRLNNSVKGAYKLETNSKVVASGVSTTQK